MPERRTQRSRGPKKRGPSDRTETIPGVPAVVAGRYEVVRRVGTGGMADVYLARDSQLDREVALKILHSQYASDESFVERFRREAHAAASLQHPNIVQIYDWGHDDNVHYIVMELVDGRSLKDVIAADAPLRPAEAARIAGQVLAALAYAHRSHVVHRDVKPGNILLGQDDAARVTDFGIARAGEGSTMTQTGTILGTAYYLSPEQAQGLPLDARSDVYSLGVVLYEMLSGQRPFEGDSPVAIAYKHVREQPRPPSHATPGIPRDLEAIVLTALQKRPEDRYSSAALMRRDLEAFSQGRDVTATIASPAPSDSTQVLRQVGVVDRVAVKRPGWLVALALALLAGGLALGTWSVINLFRPAIGTEAVPTVVKLNPDQAQRLIRARGLEPSFQGNEPSDDIAAGLITRQLPAPKSTIALGSEVKYWVSSGKPFVDVPDIQGRHVSDAAQILRTLGLALGTRTNVFDLDAPPDTVVGQNPRAGEEVRSGTPIDVTVSRGAETSTVPDVVGRTETEATRILANAGFRVVSQEEFNDDFAQDRVFAQDPGSGEDAENGSTVTIFVSRGPQSFPMPDVQGQTEAAARQELGSRDLVVQASTTSTADCSSFGGPVPSGSVHDQDPQPGVTVRRGQTVRIFVCP